MSPQVTAGDRTGHGRKPAAARERAVAALLSSGSIAAAAERAQVSERTLRRWLREPAFAATYAEARAAALAAAVAGVVGATAEALEALKASMRPGVADGVRVRAAATVLDLAFRGAEVLDHAERLEALEAALELRTRGAP